MWNSIRVITAGLLAVPSLAAPLTLDQWIKPAHVLVYELPAGDGREAAMRFITGIRQSVLPGAQVVDAGAADEATLHEKLNAPFLLITLDPANSRLLPRIAGALPLRIENGAVRWADYEAPLAESRIAFVGRNPEGSGYAVAVAIGSPALLKSMAGEEGFSYVIYRGDGLVRKGCYAADWNEQDCERLREFVISDEARQDAAQFFSTLERIHPNLLAKITVEEHTRLKQRTGAEIAARTDARGNVRSADVSYVLAYAAGRFQDGHTRVAGDLLSRRQRQQPPFWLSANDGVFQIAAATDPAIQGMELLAVNGKPVLEFLQPALDRCPAETLIAREAMVSTCYLSVDLAGPSPVSYRLQLRARDGQELERTLPSIGATEYLRLAPGLLRGPGGGTRVNFLDSGRIAHLVVPSFRFNEAEKTRIDEIFRRLKERKSEALILDLRGNGGGNSGIGDFLFSYLHAGPFRAASRVGVRDLKTGRWSESPVAEKTVARPDAFFSGPVYLLIDNVSFSSASMFAAMFRDYRAGTILGFETGGLPIHFGDSFEFRLAYSGIRCRVSYKRFWPPQPRPGDDEHGVLPDVPMTRERLAPYRDEADPVLACTLDYIRNSGRK